MEKDDDAVINIRLEYIGKINQHYKAYQFASVVAFPGSYGQL